MADHRPPITEIPSMADHRPPITESPSMADHRPITDIPTMANHHPITERERLAALNDNLLRKYTGEVDDPLEIINRGSDSDEDFYNKDDEDERDERYDEDVP